jgi:hypothetical protein
VSKWKTKTPTRYAFACEIKVAPYGQTAGAAINGGKRWTWPGPGEGPATTECGYRCLTEAQLLAHLIVTHRIPLPSARKVTEVA